MDLFWKSKNDNSDSAGNGQKQDQSGSLDSLFEGKDTDIPATTPIGTSGKRRRRHFSARNYPPSDHVRQTRSLSARLKAQKEEMERIKMAIESSLEGVELATEVDENFGMNDANLDQPEVGKIVKKTGELAIVGPPKVESSEPVLMNFGKLSDIAEASTSVWSDTSADFNTNANAGLNAYGPGSYVDFDISTVAGLNERPRKTSTVVDINNEARFSDEIQFDFDSELDLIDEYIKERKN